MSEMKQAGRLALRVEGDLWVAYFAQLGTMDGALLLGSIQMAFVQDEERKQTFMRLMQESVGEILAQATGTEPHWPEWTAAPDHERGGRA